MSPAPVVFRQQALDDLRAISSYIRARDPAAADRVVQSIHRTIFNVLAHFPYGGRLDQRTGAREFPVSGLPYVVIYVPRPDVLDIVGIFHTARNPANKPKP